MPPAIVLLIMAGILAAYVAFCVFTGEMGYRATAWNRSPGRLSRREEPVTFWLVMGIYGLIVVGFVVAAIYVGLVRP
ncbi:hypothetical protein [Phenylobacterium sp.]|uniref:hypothetical protein n=1 Tax=Phenylobacterium sp. TaxID=1871053 RepID=UPI0030F449E2